MTALPVDPDELVALGAFAGAQVLVVCFSVIIANVYRERALLLHGAATMMGVLAMQTVIGGAGLKEPLPAALTEFLHFRIVLTPSDRRILTLTAEELLA